MKTAKIKAAGIGALLIGLIVVSQSLAQAQIPNGTTVAVVIDKHFTAANSTMLQYSYTVLYMNSQIPSSTNTEIVTFLVNQTLPTNAAGFSNTVFSAIQTHVTKLPFVVPQPSTGNVIIPP